MAAMVESLSGLRGLLLRREYKFKPLPETYCFQNAIRAAVAIFNIEKFSRKNPIPFPRIVQVDFEGDVHAYIVHNRIVYSRGVTDLTGKYPNLDNVSLFQQPHQDRTLDVLHWTLKAIDSGEDGSGFAHAVTTLYKPSDNLNTALKLLLCEAIIEVGGFENESETPLS